MPQLYSYAALAEKFRAGESSPSRELDRRIALFHELEPRLKSFVHVDLDAARAAAATSDQRWRARQPLSPIDGMPIGIKDIIETYDMPTGQGTPVWEGTQTRRDAASVQALREAGAVIFGKTTTTEYASTEPLHSTTNPHDPARTAGGSSSGSAAAVGAGILPAALGTQVVGSTLRPASYCGCVGFKPTFGALNRSGSFDHLSQSCLGILAASPEDAWHVASAIASRVGGDPGHPGLNGPLLPPPPHKPHRLAVVETAGWTKASEGARQALHGARTRLRDLGIETIDRRADADIEALEVALVDATPVTFRIFEWELVWPLGTYARLHGDKLTEAMHKRLASARTMSLDDYRTALARRAAIRARHAFVGARYDALLLLGATGAAPSGLAWTGDPALNIPASLLGAPAVALPLLRDGPMPLGLQLIGLPDHDDALMATADWVWRHYQRG